MFKKNDPLVQSVQKVMQENIVRREVETKLCEELGIYSKRELPIEHHKNYDALLEQRIAEALHPNQQKLDVHEPEKDELTAKDFEMLRKGKKAEKEDMKESAEKINVELVLEGTVNVQIPASPTFEHYLAAINYLVNDRTEDVQTEIIALANEAFENQEVDVLIRAQYQRDIAEASLKMPTATGMRVMGHRYGNSADAKRNQTKKSVDLMSGPSKKAMEKISKEKAKK